MRYNWSPLFMDKRSGNITMWASLERKLGSLFHCRISLKLKSIIFGLARLYLFDRDLI
jgi:hypothetical protein